MKPYIKQFPSGIRLYFEKTNKNSQVRLNLAFQVGSQNETPEINGISHLIEHSIFLGSKKRDAKRINIDFENIGAEVNAYTGKSITCFYATCLKEKTDECFEILSDMVFNPVFDEEKINKEKKVIYSEIDRNNDNHFSLIHDEIEATVYKGTPFERSVIGKKSILKAITRQDILDYYSTHYVARNLVVSITGPLSKKQVFSLLKKYVFNMCKIDKRQLKKIDKTLTCNNARKLFDIKKEVNQDKIMLSFPIENYFSPKVPIYEILSNILGGGASSRLFSKIREELGLVYSIYSNVSENTCGGTINITLGVNEEHTEQAVQEIKNVIQSLKDDGVSQEEVDRAKIMLKTDLLSSLEERAFIALNAYQTMILYGEYIRPDKKLDDWERVTIEDVNASLEKLDFSKMTAGIVSNTTTKKVFDIFK